MPRPDLIHRRLIDQSLFDLISDLPLPSLGQSAVHGLASLRLEEILRPNRSLGSSVEAGLWLLVGELDRSHTISQNLQDATGSYWHGMMHRVEGDFANAKYWMHCAWQHPVRQALVGQIQANSGQLLQAENPVATMFESQVGQRLNSAESVAEALIDLVQRAITKQTEWTQSLQVMCWWEWQLLFQYSLDRQRA